MAYYFTGDAGLGPTRVYRNGERDSPDIWAFPILHMGKEASLEEMGFDDVAIGAVRDWLLAVTDYTVRGIRRGWSTRILMERSDSFPRCAPGLITLMHSRSRAASAGTP